MEEVEVMKNNKKSRYTEPYELSRGAKVTTLEDLKKYGSKGVVVELPPFDDSMPLIVSIKRPSLMDMIVDGVIPNPLQAKAIELFEGKSRASESVDDVRILYDLMVLFAKSCLVQPTYEDIEEAGVTLTDEQLLAIYNYAQRGSRALEPFRAEQALAQIVDSFKDLQTKTE